MSKTIKPKINVAINPSLLVKPKADKVKLLKGIWGILKESATHNWVAVPGVVMDTISAISFNESTGQLGWKLISRSLVDAVVMLVIEANPTLAQNDIETDQLDGSLSAALENKKHFIDFDFFKNPGQLPLIEKVKPLLKEFITLCGFTETEATNMMVRFNGYFVYSLANEWQSNYKLYQHLKDSLQTPFDEAAKKEYEWELNAGYLEKQINKPVFSESFSLKQIYVPLRAYYLQAVKGEKSNDDIVADRSGKTAKQKMVVYLEEHLVNWLKAEDKKDAIRIIRGGPGCGKSSFLKILAANLAAKGEHVLFIPLHRFELKDDMEVAINNFLKYDQIITINPFEDAQKLILIFDGLDELSMQGKALSELAQSFLREVERKVSNYNHARLKVQAIISGRDVIVQQSENDFRKDGGILALLPYYLNKEEQEEIDDKTGIIKRDQRNDWWKRYGKLKGKNYAGLPGNLKKREIDEITAQPLLNYLVALSYERGQIIFDEHTNLNLIYDDLLKAVHERSYAGNKHTIVRKMELEQFRRILEEVAVSSWHGNGRTTTVKEIEKHIKDGGLERLLKSFIGDADKGVISLLAAFYFRQAGQDPDGNQTFEFTHKSFGEYLTAKRIMNQIKTYPENLKRSENTYGAEGWTLEQCLISWIKLFGSKQLDMDLVKFLRNEFSLLGKDEARAIQQTMVKFINRVIEKGLPMEAITPRASTFFTENQSAINAETALLAIHSLAADITDGVSEINWGSKTGFGEWMGRLRKQRIGDELFILRFLNNLILDNGIIYVNDFYNANFAHSSLCNVEGDYSNFNFAYLRNTKLIKINLRVADLSHADLRNADLRNADLQGADLQGADLRGAYLQGAKLQGAKLQGAKFRRRDLEDVDLTAVNLDGAIIED